MSRTAEGKDLHPFLKISDLDPATLLPTGSRLTDKPSNTDRNEGF